MNNKSERPRRARLLYNTMELCHNKDAGTYGSLELIVSRMDLDYPSYYYWPLSESLTVTPDQLEDLISVVGREVVETVVTRINVQGELPGLLRR